MTLAVCRAGVIGSFPSANVRTVERLDDWLTHLDEHLARLLRHRVEMVITSVGSPAAVVDPLYDNGTPRSVRPG